MTTKIYIAGPDVFRPDAAEHFAMVRRVCTEHGYTALCPVDGEGSHDAKVIFQNNVALIREADIVIANLNPFRGAEPDSGTIWEVGFACGLGKPVFGYISEPGPLLSRVEKHYPPIQRQATGIIDRDGCMLENFGLPVNLMIANSVKGIFVGNFESAVQDMKNSFQRDHSATTT